MIRDLPTIYNGLQELRAKAINLGYSWEHNYLPLSLTVIEASRCMLQRSLDVDGIPFTPEDHEYLSKNSRGVLTGAKVFCLSSWRFTKRIYSIDPTIQEHLLKTPLDENMPTDIFANLPEWGMYVKLDTTDAALAGYTGFFVGISDTPTHTDPSFIKENDGGLSSLVIGAHKSNEADIIPSVIPLGRGSLKEAFDLVYENSKRTLMSEGTIYGPDENEHRRVNQDRLLKMLSLCLFLCSEKPDYKGGVPGGKPKLSIKGKFEFPKEPRVIQVGSVLGAKLKEQSTKSQAQGAGKKPHMRKAHWHGVWTGPKSETQKFKLNWIPPLFVNCDAP